MTKRLVSIVAATVFAGGIVLIPGGAASSASAGNSWDRLQIGNSWDQAEFGNSWDQAEFGNSWDQAQLGNSWD